MTRGYFRYFSGYYTGLYQVRPRPHTGRETRVHTHTFCTFVFVGLFWTDFPLMTWDFLAGVEPATFRLTTGRATTALQNRVVTSAGFEPAIF